MSPRFKHHALPSAPGHDRDEKIETIYRKTTKQLQEHYDKMQRQHAASYSTANPTHVTHAAALHVQLHQTCWNLPPPTIMQTAPRAHPQRDA
eukprot:13200124-Ditylum_brightwellii.AAC.1